MKIFLQCVILIHTFMKGFVVSQDFGDFSAASKDLLNFGPYILNLKSMELCKLTGNTEVVLLKEKQSVKAKVDISLDKPCTMTQTKSRIALFKINGETKKNLYNYKIKNMCDHFALGETIMASLNMDKKHCRINKGNYSVLYDASAVTSNFVGPSFFYGEFLFVSNFYCNQGSLICFQTLIEFRKKDTNVKSKINN